MCAPTPRTGVGAEDFCVADVLQAVTMPEIGQRPAEQGYDLAPGAPGVMNKLIGSDITKYSKVIREAKIRIN